MEGPYKLYFPKAKFEVIDWLLKHTKLDKFSFVLRLLTVNSNQPIEFASRDDGGFIPDPRLKGRSTVTALFGEILNGAKVEENLKEREEEWLRGCGVDSESAWVDSFREARHQGRKKFELFCLKAFPPRTKGDLVIRRSRIWDVVSLLEREKEDSAKVMLQLRCKDYVHACNLAWYWLLVPHNRFLIDGVVLRDLSECDSVFSTLSDRLKSEDVEPGWEDAAEMKNLSGYRLLPWKGYEPMDDTKTLAEGGYEKTTYYPFLDMIEYSLKPNLRQDQTIVTFDEWVAAGGWLTTGASSIGHLEVEYEGRTHRVKCRKNMLVDFISLDILATEAKEHLEQVSTAFTKNELGKVRVAVCSDIFTYLKMNYLVDMSGRGYKLWKGVTRSENGKEKIERMAQMAESMQGAFGMAWDYKGFERQVKLEDMAKMIRLMGDAAESNTPDPGAKNSLRLVADECIAGLYKSTIVVPDSFKPGATLEERTLPVTGGLPSGLYITSICGDGYNSTFVWYVQAMLRNLGLPAFDDGDVYLQGDDTSFRSQNVALLQLADWLMTDAGAIGATGKFGIATEKTEFLRVSYSPGEARGYVARAIPGLTQRKPWSDSPQNEVSVIAGVIDALKTVQRRCGNGWQYSNALIANWARLNQVNPSVLRAPYLVGGYGLGNPVLNLRVTKGTTDELKVKVNAQTRWREEQWNNRAAELQVGTEEVDRIVRAERASVVIGDEVRGVSAASRKNKMEELRTRRVIRAEPIAIRKTRFVTDSVPHHTYMKYNIHKQLLNDLKLLVPNGWKNEFEARTGIRYGVPYMTNADFEAWFIDGITPAQGYLHPLLTPRISECVASLIRPKEVPKARLSDIVAMLSLQFVEHFMNTSERALFAW